MMSLDVDYLNTFSWSLDKGNIGNNVVLIFNDGNVSVGE